MPSQQQILSSEHPLLLVKNTFLDISDLPEKELPLRAFTAPPLGRSSEEKDDDNASQVNGDEDTSEDANGKEHTGYAGEDLGENDLPEMPDVGRLRTATISYEKHESWGWTQEAGFSMDPTVYNSMEQSAAEPFVMFPVTMVPIMMAPVGGLPPDSFPTSPGVPAVDSTSPSMVPANDGVAINTKAMEGYDPSLASVPSPASATLTATPSVSSNCFRVRWDMDARKLSGNDKRVVSPGFEVFLGPSYPSVPCRILLHPKVVNEGKGGGCFRKAKGKGFIQLKCEQKLAHNAAEIAIRFSIGADVASSRQHPPRGPVRHNFFSNAICGLPKDQDEWNFSSAVDKDAQTFAVCLEIVA